MSWPTVSLGEVIQEAKSGFASGTDVDDGIAQLRMNNVTRDGKLDWSRLRRVDLPRKIDHLLLERGDVLFNATNSPELVGKTALFRGFPEPLTFSNHFLRLRPIKDLLEGAFLARWLQREFASGRFRGMCKQWVNQATVSRELLLSLDLPLPRSMNSVASRLSWTRPRNFEPSVTLPSPSSTNSP
jgi:type I restriction enzyme S subunit